MLTASPQKQRATPSARCVGSGSARSCNPVFPSGPIPLTPPSLIIGFCESDRQFHPSTLEGGPRVVECLGDPSPARIDAGIETARPAPLWRRAGHARAPADYADPDVVEMDQPRFAMGIVFAAAACEQGHVPSKR